MFCHIRANQPLFCGGLFSLTRRSLSLLLHHFLIAKVMLQVKRSYRLYLRISCLLCSRSTEGQKMNNTLSNASIKCVRDTSVTAVVFPCLYSILFIVAIILNSLAAWIFFSIPSTTTFVVFLKNVVRRHAFTIIACVNLPNFNRESNLLQTGGG